MNAVRGRDVGVWGVDLGGGQESRGEAMGVRQELGRGMLRSICIAV